MTDETKMYIQTKATPYSDIELNRLTGVCKILHSKELFDSLGVL